MAAGIVAVAGLPYVTMRLWSAGGRDARIGSTFGYTLSYYLAAQGLLPLPSGDLGDATPAYNEAKAAAAARGASLVELSPVVAKRLQALDGKWLLREAMVTSPRAYLAALARTALVFAGVPVRSSENFLFVSNVSSLTVPGSKCVCPEADQPAFAPAFARPGQRTPLHYLVKLLVPVYVPLVMLGSALTIVGFVAGLSRRDPALLAYTAVPVAFAAAHVVLLLGTDRFAMPVFPLALANLAIGALLPARVMAAFPAAPPQVLFRA